jgi:tetratricopeptide (TPR) repeat protein
LAESHQGPEQEALRRRAGFWYRQAEPHLTGGLSSLKVKQRLEELSNLDGRVSTHLPSLDSVRDEPRREPTPDAARLMAEAQRSVDQKNYAEARKQLLQVNQVDEDNRQACFYLGLLAGLAEHNGSDARKYFTRCQRAAAEDVAALNNLALASVRLRDVGQAVSCWRKTVDLGPTPEVSHNIRLLLGLADRKRVSMSSSVREELEKQASLAGAAGVPMGADASAYRRAAGYSGTSAFRGWWYMDYAGESVGSTDWHWPELFDRACMQCNGAGGMDCPVTNCSRGRVRVPTVDTIALPSGQVFKKQRLVSVPCDKCRGSGRIRCPFCNDGIDRDL